MLPVVRLFPYAGPFRRQPSSGRSDPSNFGDHQSRMLPFKLIYSDEYYLPIGQHVFPAEKYRRIYRRLIEAGIADASDFLTPQPASDDDILLVHTPAYVNKLKTG